LGLICLMHLTTYLGRVIMANTAPEIQKEFGIDNFTKGVIKTVPEFIAYAKANPGKLATEAVVRASPDGYTLLKPSNGHAGACMAGDRSRERRRLNVQRLFGYRRSSPIETTNPESRAAG
jgi:hypothetical protein